MEVNRKVKKKKKRNPFIWAQKAWLAKGQFLHESVLQISTPSATSFRVSTRVTQQRGLTRLCGFFHENTSEHWNDKALLFEVIPPGFISNPRLCKKVSKVSFPIFLVIIISHQKCGWSHETLHFKRLAIIIIW